MEKSLQQHLEQDLKTCARMYDLRISFALLFR